MSFAGMTIEDSSNMVLLVAQVIDFGNKRFAHFLHFLELVQDLIQMHFFLDPTFGRSNLILLPPDPAFQLISLRHPTDLISLALGGCQLSEKKGQTLSFSLSMDGDFQTFFD